MFSIIFNILVKNIGDKLESFLIVSREIEIMFNVC